MGLEVDITEVLTTQLVLVESPAVKVFEVEVRIPGPPGPAGGEEPMKYAKRIDFVGNDIIYKGEAVPGTTDTQQLWRIKRIEFVGEDVKETWAGGTALFLNAWSDRLTYNYL